MSIRVLKHEVETLQRVLNPKPKYDYKKAIEISELLSQYEKLTTQFKDELEAQSFTPEQINAQLRMRDQVAINQVHSEYATIIAQLRKEG
jgi:hypothetical protein